ncbi:hypothetical protein GCM10025794_34370 [Massilia kyonggiensis]
MAWTRVDGEAPPPAPEFFFCFCFRTIFFHSAAQLTLHDEENLEMMHDVDP